MTPEDFRRAGHTLIDWIADYRQSLERRPVRAQVEPGETRAHFSVSPPVQTLSMDDLLLSLEQAIVPGVTQVQHPMHFGWFPSNAALSSVLGDIASAGIGALGISWESCPALTELEEVTVNWLRQWVGLSDQWYGTIHDTASTACLTALIAARERAGEFCFNASGLQGLARSLVVYTSQEAHSSVEKATLLAGFGRDNLRIIDVDPHTRAMRVDVLERTINEDLKTKCTPAAIVASLGSTGVTTFDPLQDIVALARAHNIWLHADAAMAGTAMLLPECRYLWDGIEGCRLAVMECTQMAGHDFRYFLVLCARSTAFSARHVDQSKLLAIDGRWPCDPVPRLGNPFGAQIPRTKTLVSSQFRRYRSDSGTPASRP